MGSLVLSALFAAGGPYALAYGLAVGGVLLCGLAFSAGWAARTSRQHTEPAGDYEDGPTGAVPDWRAPASRRPGGPARGDSV